MVRRSLQLKGAMIANNDLYYFVQFNLNVFTQLIKVNCVVKITPILGQCWVPAVWCCKFVQSEESRRSWRRAFKPAVGCRPRVCEDWIMLVFKPLNGFKVVWPHSIIDPTHPSDKTHAISASKLWGEYLVMIQLMMESATTTITRGCLTIPFSHQHYLNKPNAGSQGTILSPPSWLSNATGFTRNAFSV